MHLLQQHIVEVQCHSSLLGKEVQNTIADVLEKDFYPKLEIIFDQYSIENYDWMIDKLEINIDVISKKDWKKDFVNQALSKIENYLKNHFPALELNENKEELEKFGFEVHAKSAENLFFKYLVTGVVSENLFSKNIDEIVRLIEVSEDFIQKTLGLFLEHKNAFLRYYFNVPESFKRKIYSEISKFSLSENCSIFFNSEIQFSSVEELEIWLEKSEIYSEKNRQKNSNKENVEDEKNKSNDDDLQNLKSNQNPFQKNKNKVDKTPNKPLNDKNNQENQENREDFDKNEWKNDEKANNLSLEISSVYIENAGLVILQPFLLNLFEKLNLCKDEVWKDKKSQHKAVLLSQYLITGQEIFFENELVLNKLMCGFPIENVINTKQKISKKEKETCKDLLRVVLEYWAVMKDSSVEALQETFLQRAGKLSWSENHSSELWVEEKGVDVLLSSLPWGIGMIKTPWMRHFLNCYWN